MAFLIKTGINREKVITRDRKQVIEPLRAALQRKLDDDHQLMEQLHDTAVLLLASEKLEEARDKHRGQQADELVMKYWIRSTGTQFCNPHVAIS